jgi:hypothetical protein
MARLEKEAHRLASAMYGATPPSGGGDGGSAEGPRGSENGGPAPGGGGDKKGGKGGVIDAEFEETPGG